MMGSAPTHGNVIMKNNDGVGNVIFDYETTSAIDLYKAGETVIECIQRVDGVKLTQLEKERFQLAFSNGVATAIGVASDDIVLNSVNSAVLLNHDGTGIDIDYTVIATDYNVEDLVTLIQSHITTDSEVTSLVNAGYPAASASAEVITTVLIPTPQPTLYTTAAPTFLPSPDKPSNKETAPPSVAPTYTANPTPEPSVEPSHMPYTHMPTQKPSTMKPSAQPTDSPTMIKRTRAPTRMPVTDGPSKQPTDSPTMPRRTRSPTRMPITHTPTVPEPTEQPTRMVRTRRPTMAPSMDTSPTESPTDTREPTEQPTRMVRTRRPTMAPTPAEPTEAPTDYSPTEQPTRMVRTRRPTEAPTPGEPTEAPTDYSPTEQPTRMVRTRRPTEAPTPAQPTDTPTRVSRTRVPTRAPVTDTPSSQPIAAPVVRMTYKPTYQPTSPQCECVDCAEKTVVYVVGLQRVDTVSIDDVQANSDVFNAAIIKGVAESVGVDESKCEIQSVAAAKYTNYRGDAVDVIFSIYTDYGCPFPVDDIIKGRTTTDNIVAELDAAGFTATASSEVILIDYSPTASPTQMPTAALTEVIVTQVVTGVNCDSIAKESEFSDAFDQGIKDGLREPTCSVGINTISEAVGGKGCDVTYTITCVAGTNADKVEAEAASQDTANACTASLEANGYSGGACGEVMVFLDHSPTQSPTEGYLVVFEAAEALQGSCVAPEVMGSQEFIDAFETAVSSCLKIDKNDVSIQGVKMNDRDPPAVIVDYVVVAPSSSTDSKTMIAHLNDDCIPSGKITAILNQNGIPDCTATTEAVIVDRTPTQTPTSSPTLKTYMLRSYHQIYGIDLENATTTEFTDYFINYVQSIASEGPGDSNVTLIRVYDPRITPPDYEIQNKNLYGGAKSNDSNIVVEYSATSKTQNDTQIAHNLNTAIAAGVFTQSLRDAGYDTAISSTPLTVIILNPTGMPVYAPTTGPTPLPDAEMAGIVVGVVFAAGAVTLYSYYMYVHQCLRTPITGA